MKKFFSKLNNKKAYLIIILVFLTVTALISGAYGYYVHKNRTDGYVKASNFYFDSDILVEGGKTYTLNVNTKEITFELRNYADELRCSENDISYTITTTAGTLSKVSGILTKNERNKDEIILSNLENGKTYTVTATANCGYTKTISATFIVRDIENNFYKNISVKDPYVILTIWTENISGTVTIKFPLGLIPDNTCSKMEDVLKADGQFSVEIDAYSSYEFRFFKDIDYDSTKDFIVTITSDGVTTEAINKEIK